MVPVPTFLKDKGYSADVLSKITRIHAPTTRKAYESYWKKFQPWCEANNIAAHLANSVNVADFLNHLYTDLKLKLRTVESYRSAVASVLKTTTGYNPGEDDVISRLIKHFRVTSPPPISNIP